MQASVKENRQAYIGGSDVAAIMGISPFTTRYDLLLFKAGIKEQEFEGNEYTEYGNLMEEKIRAYINEPRPGEEFKEDQLINGDVRCHVDGYDGDTILEIKTTSQIHEKLEDYKVYLVQLLFYMMNYKVKEGILAVYERPEDFNEEFEPARLTTYGINIDDYKDLCQEIEAAIDKFRKDVERLKENPLLTEEDLLPEDIKTIWQALAVLENRLAEYKAIEAERDKVKKQLYEAMTKEGLKKWITPNGTQVTRVEEKPDTTEMKFNEKKFKEEQEETYNQYCEEVVKKGRAGYILITPPKSKE